jgi:hypothetical protein
MRRKWQNRAFGCRRAHAFEGRKEEPNVADRFFDRAIDRDNQKHHAAWKAMRLCGDEQCPGRWRQPGHGTRRCLHAGFGGGGLEQSEQIERGGTGHWNLRV